MFDSSLHSPYALSATPVHSPSSSAIFAGSGPPFQYWFGHPKKSPALHGRRVGDALRDPRSVLVGVDRELVVGGVEVEAVGAFDACLHEAMGRVPDAEPRAVRAVEVDLRSRLGLQRVHRVVQHREPIRSSRRRIGLRGLAPLQRVAVGAAIRVVPGDDPEAVRFEDDDCLPLADAGGEGIDPGLVLGDSRRSSGAELSAVAERDVVRDEDRHVAPGGGPIDVGLHVPLDALWRALRVPLATGVVIRFRIRAASR